MDNRTRINAVVDFRMWIAPPANRSFGIGATRWVSLNCQAPTILGCPSAVPPLMLPTKRPFPKAAMSAAGFP